MQRSIFLASKRSIGFTLIEILAATTMFTVIIGALYTVYYGALEMRDTAYATIEHAMPAAQAAGIIQEDLEAIMAPAGLLAGALLGEKNEEQGSWRRDTIEFYAASGRVLSSRPWGEVQKVEYYVEEGGKNASTDLVRALTRNLLAATTEEPEEQRLLSDVQSLEFEYYDGEEWQETWDSTARENELPEAISVRIEFAVAQAGERQRMPLELVVPIVAKAQTSEESSETGQETSGGTENPDGAGGGGGGQGPTDGEGPPGQ